MSKAHDDQRANDVEIIRRLADAQGSTRRAAYLACADALEAAGLKPGQANHHAADPVPVEEWDAAAPDEPEVGE